MAEEQDKPTSLQKVYDQLVDSASKTFQFLKDNTEHARDQVQELFQNTTDQVSEKTEEARKALQLRMAMLEIEHHLNRLYPQIGKLLCDVVEQRRSPLTDPDLQAKLDLAGEYRERLTALRHELETTPQPKPQT